MLSIIQKITEKHLKITPQRIAVLESIIHLHNHPTAENIIHHIKKNHPHIAIGTVYRVLDTLVKHGLILKVKTDNGIIRYEDTLSHHHHLYCSKTERIEDYQDEKLDKVVLNYFKKKKIKNFKIENIKLHISGTFS